MGLPNYRIIFILFLSFFFYSCESSVNNTPDVEEEDFGILGFSVNYNIQENEISIFVEISDSDNIASISSYITDNEEIIFNESLIESSVNANIFLYEGFLDLSDEIYIYDITLLFSFNDGSDQGIFSDTFSTPIKPEIIDYTIPETFQLDSTEWTSFFIDIQIENLNGANNISSVTYEVLPILNECNGEPSSEDEYISDPSWEFDYISSDILNQHHSYQKKIWMRPLNGSALEYNDECDDSNNDGICDGYEEQDCGKTGLVFFKFIVLDKDGLTDQIIDIPMEITE